MNRYEILDCTGCGSKPYWIESDYIYLACSGCDVCSDTPHLSYDAAEYHWNRVQNNKLEKES